MSLNAKGGSICIENTEMDYILFGNGNRVLIMIPGLGDGLKTVRGYALPFAMMYREYAEKYRVYVFSRRNKLPQVFSTRAMAKDIAIAMKELNIEKADVLGVSQTPFRILAVGLMGLFHQPAHRVQTYPGLSFPEGAEGAYPEPGRLLP